MASLLSNLVNNIAEGIQKIKYKNEHNKKCEACGITYKLLTEQCYEFL